MSEPVHESVTVAASSSRVLEVLSDLENTDRWANEARGAEVTGYDEDGRPRSIVVTLGAIGFTTTATYDVTYTDTSITLTCVDASLIRESTIVYTVHDDGDGTTRVDMASTMRVTVPVPRWGLERAMRSSMRKNLESVRKDAEA